MQSNLDIVTAMLRYSGVNHLVNSTVHHCPPINGMDESFTYDGFTIIETPDGFELSVEVCVPGSRMEPDDFDYSVIGTFKNLPAAVMKSITLSVEDSVNNGLIADAEAAFCREADMFWADQESSYQSTSQ